ncbi:MAG: Coenzyme F420 hydrogenase/dehydrogenase, beta subunit C-terminal domain [Sphingobium sp.]
MAALSAEQEQLIAGSCSGAIVAPWAQAPGMNPYWGPYDSVQTGHATDPHVRHHGSSGGVLSALAIHALETGLVERVLHIVADPDHPTRNIIQLSSNPQEVLAGAGSRYASSSPLADIDRLLGEGVRFAFIGKPCDVSALRQLARMDRRVDLLVPIKLSFFCGGMPSHAGAERIIQAMGLVPSDVTRFRYRGEGWPGLTRAETNDGRAGEMRYEDSWGGHLSKEVQFRCKICPDAVGGVADIACADAWYGGESGYPQFEEQDGRSLIMSRSPEGERLLRSAVGSGNIVVESLAVEDIGLMQPSQARRKRLVSARMAACSATLQPRPKTGGLMVRIASADASIRDRLRDFIGTIRRIVLNRR